MTLLTRNGRPLKCLLMGYNGVGNTGSVIRLLTAIDDVHDAFGADTQITVATLDRARTEAILPAASGIVVVEASFSPHRFITANAERREQSAAMVERWVSLARHAIEHYDLDVQLIAMEMLDTPVCEQIRERLGPQAASRVLLASSRDVPPAEMVAMLRGLDALVTSRYHACVLSMGGAVPQMAINHDERLASIYAEIGLDQEYLLHYRQADLSEKLIPTFDRMMQNTTVLADRIRNEHDNRFVPACLKNHRDLREWGMQVFDSPPQTANPFIK